MRTLVLAISIKCIFFCLTTTLYIDVTISFNFISGGVKMMSCCVNAFDHQSLKGHSSNKTPKNIFSYLVIVNKISVHPTTSACSVENEEPWQFNNVKGGIRNRKLKDRSCNDKQRKGQTIIYKTLYRKLQIEQHETKNRK
jgi:hypothetical protein